MVFEHFLITFLFALTVSAAPVSSPHASSSSPDGDLSKKIYFAAALIALMGAVIIRTRRKLVQDWEISTAESDIEDRFEGFLDLIVVDSPTSTTGPDMRQEIMIIVTDEKQSNTPVSAAAGIP